MPKLDQNANKTLAEAPTLGNLHPGARAQAIARGSREDALIAALRTHDGDAPDGWQFGLGLVKFDNHGQFADFRWATQDDIDAAIQRSAPQAQPEQHSLETVRAAFRAAGLADGGIESFDDVGTELLWQIAEIRAQPEPLEPPQDFIDYMKRNYYGDVVFSDSTRHARAIWKAAIFALKSSQPAPEHLLNNVEFQHLGPQAQPERKPRPGTNCDASDLCAGCMCIYSKAAP